MVLALYAWAVSEYKDSVCSQSYCFTSRMSRPADAAPSTQDLAHYSAEDRLLRLLDVVFTGSALVIPHTAASSVQPVAGFINSVPAPIREK